MDKLESNIRAERVRTVTNNFALEGYRPDRAYQALLDQYVACQISYEELEKAAFALFNRQPDQEKSRKLDRFESARDLLNFVGSVYSAKIYKEQKKVNPDSEAIDKWWDELHSIHRLYRSLSLKDTEGVEKTIAHFSEKYRQLQHE